MEGAGQRASIDTTTTPVEAGLSWAIQKVRRSGGAREGGFPGASKIIAQLPDSALTGGVKVAQKRVGLVALERIPVREHTPLHNAAGELVGEVTSGLLGPTTGRPIAMAYVQAECSGLGTRLNAIVRGKPVTMEVTAMPFVPPRYHRG